MDIQIPLHVPEPEPGKCPAAECPHDYARAVPQFRQMRGHDAAQESHRTENQRCQHGSRQIVEIVQEDNLRIHQEQDKIARRQAGVYPHGQAGDAESGQEDHCQQIDHRRDDELNPHLVHQLRRKLAKHLLLGAIDVRALAAYDRLGIGLVLIMEMHLHPCDEDNRGRNIGEHGKAGGHIIGLVAHEGLHHHQLHIRIPEYEIMDIEPQNIEEIRYHQFPVLSEIPEHRFIAVAVFDEIPFYDCQLQNRRQEESRHQREKHALPDAPFHDEPQEQGEQKRPDHPDKEEQRNLLVIL